MPTYMVRNKAHIRATITEELAHDGRGNTYTVRNAGAPMRFEVGDLIEDLTPDELAAFPDRFALASPADIDAYHQRKDAEEAARLAVPVAGDAAQQAAQEAALEAQITALQAQLATTKTQAAMAVQRHEALAQEAQAQRAAARTPTGQFVSGRAQAETDAARADAARLAAEKEAADKANANKK